ncbi:hypothetical protein C5D09_06390 [Rathayibacter sp. AY1C9]|uniref:hypothetical protein n=1 Tax=Rathayibacter sp. AY1C9 TaxID=2080541 RepID=UPI000CE889F8|nr:hypothetical protein [Rathayibacter sp. AY1C9]PPH47004.1 hypothetical protein C5D09_06390 [Rathayibacter sp. AY1C9]
MVTLSHSAGLTAPVRVLEVSSVSQTSNLRTIIHELIGNPVPDITVRPAGPRTGTLTYVLADKAAGQAAELLHRTPGIIRLDDPGILTMTYYATGALRLFLDPRARHSWVLTVDFIEVIR